MVLGILWVNSGTGQQSSSRDLTAPAGAARERPDIVARETVDYAAVAPQRRPLGAADADPNAPVLNPAAGVPGPEGQIVPAMQPGAALSGTSAARPTLAAQARRSTLIAYGGRDLGREAGPPTAAGAAGEAHDNAAGAPESGEGRAPNQQIGSASCREREVQDG